MRRDTRSILAVAAFAVLAVPTQMILGAVLPPSSAAPAGLDAAAARRAYAALPLAFEENRGQVGPGPGFVARGSGYAFLVGAAGATLEFTPGARRGRSGARPAPVAPPPVDVMRIELIGADPHAAARPAEPAGTTSSFLGHDPGRWRTAVPDYTRVEYRAIYPGIDVAYHGIQGSLEYDFLVAPGADPRQIRLRVDGTPALNGSGEVALALTGGTMVQHPATAYQPAASPTARPHPTATVRPARAQPAAPHRRPGTAPPSSPAPVPVGSGYVLGRGGELHLTLGPYDRSRPLVIDPVVTWSPAVGGGLDDSFVSTADEAGAAYVVTGTPSPAAPGGPVTTDVAVLKLDRAGRVVYRTFLGGEGTSGPSEVTVDDTGALEISGVVAPPATGPALLADRPGRRFTMRLDPRGLPLPQTGAAAG
jgi:hypothetical protein